MNYSSFSFIKITRTPSILKANLFSRDTQISSKNSPFRQINTFKHFHSQSYSISQMVSRQAQTVLTNRTFFKNNIALIFALSSNRYDSQNLFLIDLSNQMIQVMVRYSTMQTQSARESNRKLCSTTELGTFLKLGKTQSELSDLIS